MVSSKKIKEGVKSKESLQRNQEIVVDQSTLEKNKFWIMKYPEFLKMRLSLKSYYTLSALWWKEKRRMEVKIRRGEKEKEEREHLGQSSLHFHM